MMYKYQTIIYRKHNGTYIIETDFMENKDFYKFLKSKKMEQEQFIHYQRKKIW